MSEIKALTGIRGFAAIWVLFFHFEPELSQLFPQLAYARPFLGKGYIGVDLFFVLSGFIITYVYSSVESWNWDSTRAFIVKRFARIYPVHLVTLLALVVMVVGANLAGKVVEGNYSFKALVCNVFMLQGFPIHSAGGWNYPSWSISAEFFGYIVVFPITVLLFKSEKIQKLALPIGISLLVALLIILNLLMGVAWMNMCRITFEFSIGASLYYVLKGNLNLSSRISRCLPIGVISAVALCFIPNSLFPVWLVRSVLIISCPLLIAGLASDEGRLSKFLGRPGVRYLGLISYSLYMCHALIQKVFKVLLPTSSYSDSSVAVRFLVFIAYVVSPIILAAFLYHLCEEPFRKLIQKRCLKRKT